MPRQKQGSGAVNLFRSILDTMNLSVSRKRQLHLIIVFTLIYAALQLSVILIGDASISRYVRLEQGSVKEATETGKPVKHEWRPVLKIVSDHHFWILRAGLIATIILAFYYKGRDEKKYILCRNISLSALLLLFLASGLLTWTLKILIGRPRPYKGLSDCMPLAFSAGFQSFPSGHTSETFSYLFPYMYFLRRYSVTVFLFILSFGVSLLRVVLSYHYISDVFFSVYFTVLTGYIICIYIDEKPGKNAIHDPVLLKKSVK